MPEECDGIEQCCNGTWFQYAPCCPEPGVSAGPDQEIEGLEGAFAGQADNYDSVIWTQISGPEVDISVPSSLTSTFTFSEAGTAVFELSATNTCGTVSDRVSIVSASIPDFDIQWDALSDSSHNVVQTPEPYNLQNQTGATYVATDLYNDPPTEDFYGLERLIIISRGNFTLIGQALLQLGGVSSFSGEYIARVLYVKNADAPVELGRIATSVWGSIEETVPVNLSLVNGDTLNLYFEIQSDAWQEGDAGNALIHFSDFTVMPT